MYNFYQKVFYRLLISLFVLSSFSYSKNNSNPADTLKLSMDQCIQLTLKNHKSRTAANFAIKAAESKIKQANSGHYPKIDVTSGYTLLDEDINFIMPATSIQTPPINLGTFFLPSLQFNVPEQDIKIADRQIGLAQFDFVLPIYLGGKISSFVRQAEANLEIAKQNAIQNDDQIIFETKKLYYSVILAKQLKQVALDAHDRMDATLQFTKSLYEKGSGKVTRSDYLKNKMFVEAIKSVVAQLSGEQKIAEAALVNAMGLEWNEKIAVDENRLPTDRLNDNMENLVSKLLGNNPYIKKIENGLVALESKIDESKGDYLPSIAILGSAKHLFTEYDYGFTTKKNKTNWSLGIGMSINIFNGLRNSAQVEESEANFYQLAEQKELLKKGLILKLQSVFYKLESTEEKRSSSQEAATSAAENRELIEKAYFSDLMELSDLIQAQLMESMMQVQLLLVQYEYCCSEAELKSILSAEKY